MASDITRWTPLDALPEFLRVEEMAALLGISRGTAYQLCRSGAIDVAHCGRLLRVPKAALVAWMAGRNQP